MCLAVTNIDEACRSSPIGKLWPDDLYVHRSAVDAPGPLLHVYEGCGRALFQEDCASKRPRACTVMIEGERCHLPRKRQDADPDQRGRSAPSQGYPPAR